jgi:Heat-labile enterotoxin alpha chain
MHISSFFVYFSLIAPLLATILYRGDSRGPKAIQADGGFKAKGYDSPEGTLFQHCEGTLAHPSKDPFIPTSETLSVAESFAGSGYLYTIDSTHITSKIHDVAAEYKAAGRKYGHCEQEEMAVEHFIPWSAITQVQKKVDGVWKTVKITKRASN